MLKLLKNVQVTEGHLSNEGKPMQFAMPVAWLRANFKPLDRVGLFSDSKKPGQLIVKMLQEE